MVISRHAGTTLLHQAGSFEPQRTSNFALVISGLPEVDKVILTIKSTTVPGLKITKQSIKYFNQSVHYAGALEPVADANVLFRDYLDVDTITVLAKWFKQVFNPSTGAIGWARDYKKQADLFLLPPGIENATAPGAVTAGAFRNRIFKMYGVFPVDLSYPQLDHDTPGTNAEVTCNLSVDLCVPAAIAT